MVAAGAAAHSDHGRGVAKTLLAAADSPGSGYTIKDSIRIGLGYNFSTYTDDEFNTLNHSFKGFFLRLQGKM